MDAILNPADPMAALPFQIVIIVLGVIIGALSYLVLVPAKPRNASCSTPYACDTCDTCGRAIIASSDRVVTHAGCVPHVAEPSLLAALLGERAAVVVPPINRPEVDADWLPRASGPWASASGTLHPPVCEICSGGFTADRPDVGHRDPDYPYASYHADCFPEF